MRQGRQQQPPTDRIAHFALTPVQAHPHLAVRNLAERPTVLPGYADRVFTDLLAGAVWAGVARAMRIADRAIFSATEPAISINLRA
jgi:hypothetical protein